MTERIAGASPQHLARIAGGLYLIIIVGGFFAIGFVPAAIVVPGDAAATAHNILAHELLYRLGLAAHIVILPCNIALALIFYELFKVVNRRLSLLVVFFTLVGTAIEGANVLNQFAPLMLLGGGHYLSVFTKVRAASVNALDGGLMKGRPYSARILFGLRKPKDTRPCRDVAGQVEAVGRNVTQFKPGDEVFGSCISSPQDSGVAVWVHCQGAFAEYVCAPESTLVVKPDNVTFEQAVSVPIAPFTSLQGLRNKGHIQPGQKVLINGAAGGVGTFAVQIAKSLGTEVTGVCSTSNVDMVRSIGADHVIDYTQEDFTTRGQRYDLFFDCIGNHSFRGRAKRTWPSCATSWRPER